MFRSHFRMSPEGLIIEVRPTCGKCKKEFMLYLTNYLPGKSHSCISCGNIIRFDEAVTERVQKLTRELEAAIEETVKDLQKRQ
jgi:hypothetical protein